MCSPIETSTIGKMGEGDESPYIGHEQTPILTGMKLGPMAVCWGSTALSVIGNHMAKCAPKQVRRETFRWKIDESGRLEITSSNQR